MRISNYLGMMITKELLILIRFEIRKSLIANAQLGKIPTLTQLNLSNKSCKCKSALQN